MWISVVSESNTKKLALLKICNQNNLSTNHLNVLWNKLKAGPSQMLTDIKVGTKVMFLYSTE